MFRSIRQSQASSKSLTFLFTLVGLWAAALFSQAPLPELSTAAHAQIDPSPLVIINLPDMAFPDSALIGEKFCYTARIVNTSSSNIPGYGPYLRLFLEPGLTLDAATLPGISSSSSSTQNSVYPLDKIDVGVFPAGSTPMLFDPLSNTMVNGQSGHHLWLIKAPIGSLYDSEPGIDLNICLRIDPAVALGGLPLAAGHVPVYQYGDSPLGNTAIVGGFSGGYVNPLVVKLSKRALNYTSNKLPPNPTVEAPTGACNPLTFELIANIADSKTLDTISLQDQLPSGMTLVNNSVTVLGATNPFSNCTNYGSNFVCVTFSNETGKPLPPPDEFEPRDLVVQFQAYVNNNVLNPTTCDAALITNTATLDGTYNLLAIPQQTDQLLIEVEHVTIQKTAAGPNVNDPLHVMPGDNVTYKLSFQVSENTNVSNVVITDVIPNGVDLPLFPTATLMCAGSPTSFMQPSTITNNTSNGTKTLTFNLGNLAACTNCMLSYGATVQQTYRAPLAGQPVLASDPLIPACGGPTLPPQFNCTTITYNLPDVTPTCRDNTFGGVLVKPVNISKTIANPQAEYKPGDIVTFQLKMNVPSGDTKNSTFTDFLPAPIFAVGATQPFNIHFGPNHNVGGTFSVMKNATDNSVKFTFSDVTTTSGTPMIEIEFSVTVTTKPFADDLYLTNLFQSQTTNTAGEVESHLTGVVLHVRAPKLKLTKGVFSSNNPDAVISPPPSPTQPDPPVNGNITGVDAGDQVTFYLTVKNEGGAPAHAISVKDVLPPCFKYISSSALAPAPAVMPTITGLLNGGKTLDFNFGTNVLPMGVSWVIQVVVQLPPHSPVAPNELNCDALPEPCRGFTNNAQATWSSDCSPEEPGLCIPSPTFPTPATDAATIEIAKPAIAKTLVSTNQPHTTDLNVAIGEKLKYLVKIRLPEGKFNNVKIMDTLDPGLAVVDAAITPTTTGPITTSNPLACAITPLAGPTGGGMINCDLGVVTNSDNNNGSAEFIEFMYEAVVLNVSGNEQGTPLSNTVKWTSTECANVTYTPLPVKVVEPKLLITKTPSVTNADAGDVITWTINISHDLASNASAFQVSLSDLIPAIQGLTYVNSSLMHISGIAPTTLVPPPASNQPLTASWSSLAVGESSIIKFQTLVGNGVRACSTLSNSATLKWESIPTTSTPLSVWNTNSCPRTGNPANCGAPDNYSATAVGTVSVPSPTLQKTVGGQTQGLTATIGEVVTFNLTICLPEGTTPNLTIKDDLPAGLEAISATLLPGLAGAGPLTVTPGCGAIQTFTLQGIPAVPADNNPANNCFTIELQARVCDIPGNMGAMPDATPPIAATVLTNSFTAEIPGDEPGLPPICTSTSNAVPVTVVEPKLLITKSFTPQLVQPGATVQITVTVTNTGTSNAFGLALQDVLGSCLTYLSASVPTNYTALHNTGTVTITGNPNLALEPGAAHALTFTFTVRVGDCCFVPNTVTASASTLPGPNVPGERPITATGSATLLVNGSNCPCVDAPQLAHLMGWWPFDELAGATVVNDISGKHHGTPKPSGAVSAAFGNDPRAITGLVKGAFDFAGASMSPAPFVEVPDHSSLDIGTNDLTIDAWINPRNFGTPPGHPNQPMVKKFDPSTGKGYDFFLEDATGKLVLKIGDGPSNIQTYKSTTALVTGQWQQVAVTVKRSAPAAVTFYLNGNPASLPLSSPPVPTGGLENTNPLLLGGCFEMAMDEIEIFEVALTQAELQTIVSAASGGKCKCAAPPAQMVAWYPLDEKNGFNVADIVGGNTGHSFPGPLNSSGSPAAATGLVNGAIFNNNAYLQYLSVPVAPASPLDISTGNFSIDAWVYVLTLNPTSARVVLDKVDEPQKRGYAFYVQGNKLKLVMGDGTTLATFTSATTVGLGWQHVAVTVDRANGGKFILNGGPVLAGDNFTPLTGNISSAERLFLCGTGISTLNGGDYAVDEIEIFSGVVTVDEMKAIAAARQLGKCPLTCAVTSCACGSFTPAANYAVGTQPLLQATADFDADGDLDLAVPNVSSNNVSILTNDGAGVFSPAGTFGTALAPLGLAVGQFNTNTDNDPDVVTVSQSLVATLTVLLGSTGASFTPGTPITTAGSDPAFVTVADFNNDLKDDLAIVNLGNGAVYIKLGVGDGTFTNAPSMPIQTGALADSLVVGNFDNNANPDFAVIHRNTNQATIFLGSGGGLFSQAPTLSTGTNPFYAGVGDFNEDGKQDLAVANFTGGDVSVFLSNGNGTFGAGTLFSTGSGPRQIAVQDYNNDGKLDLAVARSLSSAVSLLCGNGDGTFKPSVTLNVGSGPFSVISGDFNGDTKPDLATSNRGSNNVSILLNNCITTAGTFITINPATLPHSMAGTAYSQLLTQTGCVGGATWSLAAGSLPTGLSLNTATGLISGLPTTPGSFTFTVKVSCASGCMVTRQYTVSICSNLVISPTTLPDGVYGTAYNQTLTQTAGIAPVMWSVSAGALPNGLMLDAATGMITGVPTSGGSFTIKVTDANGCMATRTYTMGIACPIVTVSPGDLPPGRLGQLYPNTNFTASGGVGPYTLAVSNGTLPPGLSLTNGQLAGTPTQTGTFNFTVKATDANSCQGTRAYTLVIDCATITVNPANPTLPAGVTGTAYNQSFTATGGTGPYTFLVNAGALPTGLTLNAAGLLSGTPTVAGVFNFTVQATGASGCTGTRAYTLTINQGCLGITIVINPATLVTGFVGKTYNQTLTATGGAAPYAFAVTADSLPNGLTLASSGALTGLPTATGTFNFTVTATDANGCTNMRAYALSIRTRVKADFDGDGKTDLSVFRPTAVDPVPNWLALSSLNSQALNFSWGGGYAPYFDVPVPGDYDGDGQADYAIWRGADTFWYLRRSSDAQPVLVFYGANFAPYFDIPTPGDFDGDGKTDIAVYRRSGTWFVRRSTDGGDTIVNHGQAGDVPLAADFDGDGKCDFGLFRPDAVAPAPNWLILQSSTNTVVSLQWGGGYAPYFDTPVPADYDGDGKADLAIWRGADSIWYIRPSASPNNPILDLWGANYAPYNDIPTPGDYDGDGKADIAVFRRTGTWFVKRSSNGTNLIQDQGQQGDIPLPANGVR